jgi:hypothetical protein
VILDLALPLLLTVVLLVVVIATGARRRRGAHYKAVIAFFLSLGVAIWRARAFGAAGGLNFAAAATSQLVHRIAIAITFLIVPFLVVSGVRLARATGAEAAGLRLWHKRLAMSFVVSFLITALLGVVMTWQAVAAAG